VNFSDAVRAAGVRSVIATRLDPRHE
jgi:hypothetical protein